MRILWYLKNNSGQGLFFFSQNDFSLRVFCDSDWRVCLISRRSTTSYGLFLGLSLISWRRKRQKTLSLSSAEVEYRYMTGAGCELSWLRSLLKDLKIFHSKATLLYCNNKATLHIASNLILHEMEHVPSAEQIVNVFTKPLGNEAFLTMKIKLGVHNIHSQT
ncbi:putative RNA-directed DNA polymerase [Lupinus albus]|uniref:Putative RNA-directed DNA polymerase n=1 Tax=Lupinus albus TaxID=3870 RepID=A0A6A4PNF4_LUPAL|nr:putative RNA-directed DNA polymerase [Lupinus albus]